MPSQYYKFTWNFGHEEGKESWKKIRARWTISIDSQAENNFEFDMVFEVERCANDFVVDVEIGITSKSNEEFHPNRTSIKSE